MASTETRRIQFDFIARDRGVQRTTRETGEAIEDMNDGVEAGSGKMGKLGAVAGKLGPILGAVAGAAALIGPAIAKGLDAQEAGAKLQAQLGVTAKESQRIGGVAGRLYSKAYGENMDEVRESITKVIQNMDGMRTASSADLQATSKRAMDLAAVMGEEVGPVTVAVGQMMKTGLAKNSREAFDILTRGAQMGANKAEDLLETFNEYSTQFRDLGLSGAQAMGIIQQGLQGGARDADVVADAMKELNIRVQDMSAAPALEKLGLNADKMAAAFGKGGPVARQALDQITDRLRKVTDPTKRYALAQQILGTQSEDMGKALLKIDPSEATKKMGQFTGATDRAGKALHGTFKARLTGFKRTVETQVTQVAAKALDGLAKFGGQIRKGFQLPKTGKAVNDWQRFGVELRKVADWARSKLVPALRDMGDWISKKIAPAITKFYKTALKDLFAQLRRIYGEIAKSDVPWEKILKVFRRIYEFVIKFFLKMWSVEFKIALKIVGTWIVYSIKSFRLLWKVLEIGWASIKKGWKAWLEYYGKAKPAIDKIKDAVVRSTTTMTRMFLNFATNVVKGAAKAFGWVPGLGGKLKGAAKAMEKFRKDVNDEIGKITAKRNVNMTVNARGLWVNAHDPARRFPGLAKAKGGPIPSIGPESSRAYDSVPALLRVDEHVWTPEEVDDVGGHGAMLRLRALARKGLLKGYSGGGRVSQGMGLTATTPNVRAIRQDLAPIPAGMTKLFLQIAKTLAKMFGGANGVVAAARSMIGYPYSWGGGGKGGPSYGIGRGAGTYGFDCSGLTEYAWWKGAKVSIGGDTYSQFPNSHATSRRPGALGFPHMGHVVIASDKPGHIIQAPFTGSHVQEVASGRGYAWRWPNGARFYTGGAVGQAARAAMYGATRQRVRAEQLGMLGNPGRRRKRGGRVGFGTPYLVGEESAEVMVPASAGTVHRAGSKVVVVHQHIDVTVKVPPTVDKGAIGREINECLFEYKKRGGRLAAAGGRA
ncbi:phage tail tape measure protein [Actinomadura sp. WMMA1423]|uniref:phage tail tape measure protein n=1 Tax=Actinomadura sp. WMMA1423 TaxID=2591108 RepID=UPI001146983B|nr:phage tail tape measure protein [Actinomadura sp. WMMA1423]